MVYGIDDTIQQKVDAYRGNPAALQRRYAQNKELIDLLALQKLKSEKDAAARDMQMKMQQTPQTIAQQYEAELAGRTKAEMLQGIAGVMKNRQNKQRANIQRMAQGIPAVAPKRMMAQGGIIGFADGNTPQDKLEKIAEIRERLARGVIDQDEADRLIEALAPTRTLKTESDEVIGQGRDSLTSPVVAAQLDYTKKMQGADKRAAAAEAGAPRGGALSGTATSTIEALDPNIGQFSGNIGQNQILGATTNISPPPPAATVPEEAPPVVSEDPPPAKPPVPQLGKNLGQVDIPDERKKFLDRDAYGTKLTDASTTKPLMTGIDRLMTQDPTQKAKEQRDIMEKYGLGLIGMSPERIAAEKARQEALAALDAQQQDPKKLERERRGAYLRGLSRAGTLAGGSQGLANLRAQQELAERNRLLQRQDIERDFEGKQQKIKETVFAAAIDASKSAYDQANQNIRSGISALSQLNTAEVNMLSKNADRILNADVANMEAEDRDTRLRVEAAMGNASQEVKVAVANLEAKTADRRLELERELDELKLEQLDRAKADQTLANIANYMGKVRAEYEKIYKDRINSLQVQGGEGASEAIKALREEMNAAIVIALGDLRNRANAIEKRLTAQYGTIGDLTYEGSE